MCKKLKEIASSGAKALVRLMILFLMVAEFFLLFAYYRFLGWAYEKLLLVTLFSGFVFIYILIIMGSISNRISAFVEATWAFYACCAYFVSGFIFIWFSKYNIFYTYQEAEGQAKFDEKSYSFGSRLNKMLFHDSREPLAICCTILSFLISILTLLHMLVVMNKVDLDSLNIYKQRRSTEKTAKMEPTAH
ncbi:uncharacterized protein LOC106668086 isoform X2 [Cimex lectularius]|uniref:Uncharacterized protein n=1 Tax=Cimex lectularius TaxID=79782 RepID=A0A8I6RT30_CIMLE|nr:uncharacterized protein LOC106668086 isoform X2 [Cimex lectularius]